MRGRFLHEYNPFSGYNMDDMKPYVNNNNKLRQNAILLYPYILDRTILHGCTAEILGISKLVS